MEEKIEILYKILVNGLKLDKKTLMIYGINEDDINRLVAHRIIVYDKKTKEYKLVKIEKFHHYGIGLLLRQKIDEANTCFRICYDHTKNGKNICLQVLLAAVSRHDYDEAFEIFSNLENIKPDLNKENNNLYLYLLSMITKCPNKYIDRAKNLDAEDIMLPLTVGNKVENEIRSAIIQNKFTYAYQLVVERSTKETGYSVKFELIRVLLLRVLGNDKKFKSNLLSLAENSNYASIVSILRESEQQRRLSKLERSILLVADAIVNITKTGIIPESTIDTTEDMHEAISGNNFELALRLNEEFLQFGDVKKPRDTINILLLKLIDLIREVEKRHIKEELDKQRAKAVLDIEEWAYYISGQNMSLKEAQRLFGLLPETVLLIKLIYARDYYIESNYPMGDQIIAEVESDRNKTDFVTSLLEEIKSNMDSYFEQLDKHSPRFRGICPTGKTDK